MKVFSRDRKGIGIAQPQPAWRISAFLDGECLGTWQAGTLGGPVFEADLTRLGPGSHRLRVVRTIDWGLEITERVIEGAGTAGLYYADIPETFEPNEPFIISGFNLGNRRDLAISDIRNEIIYDVNILPGRMDITIPTNILKTHWLCEMSLTDEEIYQEGVFGVSGTPNNSDRKRYEKLLKKRFDPNDWEGKRARVVFLLPDRKVTRIFWQAICSAVKAAENRRLPYAVLSGYDVNQQNLDFLFFTMPGRRIVIYFGHANSHVGDVQRTRFQCFRQSRVANPGAFYDLGAFSYTRRSRPAAIPLPYYYETPHPIPLDDYAFDLYALRNSNPALDCRIDKMFIFGCLSAAYPDMAEAQGCGSEHDHAWGDMMYGGYRYAVLQTNGGWAEGIGDNLVRGISIFFDKLGETSEKAKTVWDGIMAIQQSEIGIRRQCLGFNGMYDADPSNLDHQLLIFYGLHALDQKLE